jgi:tRNA 5-methylaminomethyl-2-thiouridine biosynthesis bifunctional protein
VARVPGRCAVVGGGLAGAAVAASLARRGWSVEVFDAAPQPASGASSLPAGLLAPRHSRGGSIPRHSRDGSTSRHSREGGNPKRSEALDPRLRGDDDGDLLSQLTRVGVRMTLEQATQHLREGIDWSLSGVDTRSKAGVVHHAQAAWIRPAALVHAWLASPAISWRGGVHIENLDELASFDLVVVACALASTNLVPLKLEAVRGQVSWGWREANDVLPPRPVNGNGHFIPCASIDGRDAWLTGSTYVRGDRSVDERPEEHLANLQRIRKLAPEAAAQLAPRFSAGAVRAWTGIRCASTDRRPLVGMLDERVGVSTAMGSRGLTFAALCAELLAAQLHGEPLPLSPPLAAALDVHRQFLS